MVVVSRPAGQVLTYPLFRSRTRNPLTELYRLSLCSMSFPHTVHEDTQHKFQKLHVRMGEYQVQLYYVKKIMPASGGSG